MELSDPWAKLYLVAFGMHWLTSVLGSSLFATLLSVCFAAALATYSKAKVSFKAFQQIVSFEQALSISFKYILNENFY